GDGQCSGSYKCNTGNGRCAACLDNSHCSNPNPICSTGTYTCSGCTGTGQCSGSLKCDTGTGKCVECLTKADCLLGNQHICRSNSCQACLTDTECSPLRCKQTPGKCVECLGDSDCTDPYKPVCNSNNQCEKCTSD